MRTASAAPYLLPPASAIAAEAWRHADGTEIGDRVEHWDPAVTLDLNRTITVDVDSIRSSCALRSDAGLAVSVFWHSNRTRITQPGTPAELGSLAGQLRLTLALIVPGDRAGGRLDLVTRIFLRTADDATSPIAPSRPGTILWTDRTQVALEGTAARFPVASVDFASVPRLPSAAAWSLEWNPADLESPVLGGLRLLVNSTNATVVGAVRPGGPHPSGPAVRSFMTFDLARTLIHSALANDQFIESAASFEADSIGRMIAELIGVCWPGMALRPLAGRLVDDPGRLDAELQAHLGMLA